MGWVVHLSLLFFFFFFIIIIIIFLSFVCLFLKVIPKDAATMLKLEEAIKHNLLFQHLEKDELIDVMDAMFVVKCAAGEEIITQVTRRKKARRRN